MFVSVDNRFCLDNAVTQEIRETSRSSKMPRTFNPRPSPEMADAKRICLSMPVAASRVEGGVDVFCFGDAYCRVWGLRV